MGGGGLTATSSTAIGALFGGRYRIRAQLGAGGMGRVLVATDENLGALVAVKIIGPTAQSREGLARFRREARVAARIDHPCVVRTLDFGSDDRGVPYLVMEYVDGCSLASVLDRVGNLSLESTLWIVRQLLRGLEAAHASGVVHRDLKPDNMLLSIDDRGDLSLKIVDFGLSHVGEADGSLMTAAGSVLGTPGYMSPEQLAGDVIDARVDVYSVGVLAFELVTGALPFGDHRMMLMTSELENTARAQLVASRLAPDVIAWIMRALAFDRQQRFPSAGAALSELSDLLAALPPSSATSSDASGQRSFVRPLARLVGELVQERKGRVAVAVAPTARDPVAPPEAALPRAAVAPIAPARFESVPPPKRLHDVAPVVAFFAGGVAFVGAALAVAPWAWRGPFPWSGAIDVASESLTEGIVSAAWLVFGMVGLALAARRVRRWVALLGFSQALYHAFVVVRVARPAWTDGVLVGTLGHGAVMGALATGLPIAAALGKSRDRRVRPLTIAGAVASLVAMSASGTRAWSHRDATGLHAGPLLLAVTVTGVVLSIALGAWVLRRARDVRDEAEATTMRIGGFGMALFAAVTAAEVLPYLGFHAAAFAMIALVPIAMLAYALIDVDALLLANPRALLSLVGGAQSIARAVVALSTAAVIVLFASNARAPSSLFHALLGAPTAIVATLAALRVLSLEKPSVTTLLIGISLGAFSIFHLSVVGDSLLDPVAALWLSRFGNAAIGPFAWATALVTRREVGRRSEGWLEAATGYVALVFVPLALSDGYFVESTRVPWGYAPRAGWAMVVGLGWIGAIFAYIFYLTFTSLLKTRGRERELRLRSVFAMVGLCLTAATAIPTVFGFAIPPLSSVGFLPCAVLVADVWRDEVEAEPLVDVRALLRVALTAAVAIPAAAALTVTMHALDGRASWLVGATLAVVLVLSIGSARSLVSVGASALFADDEADLQLLQRDLARLAERAPPPSDLARQMARIVRSALRVEEVIVITRGERGGLEREGVAMSHALPFVDALLRRRSGVVAPTPLDMSAAGLSDDKRARTWIVGARMRDALPAVAFVVRSAPGHWRSEAALLLLRDLGWLLALSADYARLLRQRHRAADRVARKQDDPPHDERGTA